MTTSQEQVLCEDLETSVRATPGVTTIFRSGTIVSNAIDAGARLLGVREEDSPLIRVETTPQGARVEVAIGVRADVGAVQTTPRVHAAIGQVLARHGIVATEIRITVVHVEDAAP